MKIFATILLVLLGLSALLAQPEGEWVVPDEDSAKLSPFAFTEQSVESGEEAYYANCKSCHGDPGKMNYQPLQPEPGDITTDKIQQNSDGEIHYKVVTGRGAMPGFANVLSDTEIWNVVAYIRSFNDDYVQQVAKKVAESAFEGQGITIALELVKEKMELLAYVEGLDEGEKEPIAGAELKLFAKRYFGNLPIGSTKKTNEQGRVVFALPDDLPGDSAGLVTVNASLSNQELYGEVAVDTALAFGVPTDKPGLTEQRAMWNVASKAPIWLILSYSLGVLLVWGTIFYVLLQLRRIYLMGKNLEEK